MSKSNIDINNIDINNKFTQNQSYRHEIQVFWPSKIIFFDNKDHANVFVNLKELNKRDLEAFISKHKLKKIELTQM